jgi:type IV pilus assembly protein PilA
MNKKQKGFSLIELLIVVAIILIIAAIAIPNLLRSRMAANEASAVGSIRTMNTAAITYSSTYGNGFPPLLTSIGTTGATAGCDNASLLDTVLTLGTKSGYLFGLQPGSVLAAVTPPTGCTGGYADGYVVTAQPVTTGTTGQRSFCSDASGVIRQDPTGTKATAASALCPVALAPLQ